MRLIDADELLTDPYFQDESIPERALFIEAVEDSPTIEAEPVKHGRWVNPYINFYGHPCHCCSECGFKASYQDKNYFPNCGARMDGGKP